MCIASETSSRASFLQNQIVEQEDFFESVQEVESNEDLKYLCEKSVENIRQVIVSLGETLQAKKYDRYRLQDLYAAPERVIEYNVSVLTKIQSEIIKKRLAIRKEDERLFYNSSLTLKDVKDWGYRGVDYLAAAVALALILLGTSDETSAICQNKNNTDLISKGSLTAILLIVSKVLSAVTDYRNKKKYEKEVELGNLKDLSYKCKKAKEASAILKIMRSVSGTEEIAQNIYLRNACCKTLDRLGEDIDGILDLRTAQLIKKYLTEEIEDKVKRQLMICAPSLMHFNNPQKILSRNFYHWKELTLEARLIKGLRHESEIATIESLSNLSLPEVIQANIQPKDSIGCLIG